MTERESLLVERIREAERVLTGWANQGADPLPLRVLLLEAADEVDRLQRELATLDRIATEHFDE